MTKKSIKDLQNEIRRLRKQLQMPCNPATIPSGLKSIESELGTLRYLHSLEFGSGKTLSKQLIEDGIELPDPDSSSDEELTAKLWTVIEAMADKCVFLVNTNHLSDRELYEQLWKEVLNMDALDLSGPGICGQLVDMSDIIDEASEVAHLQYYADKTEREYWEFTHEGISMPPQSPMPYNRDSSLPALVKNT